MPEKKSDSTMGDIIGSTRQRLEQPIDASERLKSLVAATTVAKPSVSSRGVRESSQTALPNNYFPQVAIGTVSVPKRKPQRGPARSLHISMRMSPPERDRLVNWCEERNLSLPDGIIALLELAKG